MDVFGTVTAAIGTVQLAVQIIQLLKNKKDAFKRQSALFAGFENDFVRFVSRLESLKTQLHTSYHLIPTETREQFRLSLMSIVELKQELAETCDAMKEDGPPKPHHPGRPFLSEAKKFWKADVLEKKLTTLRDKIGPQEEVMTLVSGFCGGYNKIDELRKMLSQITVTGAIDQYHRRFNAPAPPHHMVFDFEGRDAHGNLVTPEARFLEAILGASDATRQDTSMVSAAVGSQMSGAEGMGGVGKSCALQQIGRRADVQDYFKDGVLFMSFGKEASPAYVVSQIARIVSMTGGKKLSGDIQMETGVLEAVQLAAGWFEGKKVLFLCDDLWATDGSRTGYLNDLRQLLSSSSGSRMGITTRRKWMASEVGATMVEFAGRDGETSWKIFCEYAHLKEEGHKTRSDEIKCAKRAILDRCGGHPLALGIAGVTVQKLSKHYGGMKNALVQYANDLPRRHGGRLLKEHLGEYDGLRCALDASVRACKRFGVSEETGVHFSSDKQVDMEQMYTSLCVFEKQRVTGISILRRLWDLDSEEDAQEIVDVLCEFNLCNLVSGEVEVIGRSNGGSTMNSGIKIHDLVVDDCRRRAVEEGNVKEWHESLLRGYWGEFKRDGGGGDVYETHEWWAEEFDEYMNMNICRHLRGSGRLKQLIGLLTDARWMLRRLEEDGGLALLKDEFEVALERDSIEESGQLQALQYIERTIEAGWALMRENRHDMGFQLLGRLLEKTEVLDPTYVCVLRRFEESVEKMAPRPFLRPKQPYFYKTVDGESPPYPISGSAYQVAMTENGNQIFYLCRNSSDVIHVLDTKSQEVILKLRGCDSKQCLVFAMSKNPERVFGGFEDGSVWLWELGYGCKVKSESRIWKCENQIDSLFTNRDGTKIAVMPSYQGLMVVGVGRPGEVMKVSSEVGFRMVGISDDGNTIAAARWNEKVTVWSLANGKYEELDTRHEGEGLACWIMDSTGKKVVHHRRNNETQPYVTCDQLQKSNSKIVLLEVIQSPYKTTTNGRLLVFSNGSKLYLVDLGKPQAVSKLLGNCSGVVKSLWMSESGRTIVIGTRTTMQTWDVQQRLSESIRGEIRPQETRRAAVACVARHGDHVLVCWHADGTLSTWDIRDGRLIKMSECNLSQREWVYAAEIDDRGGRYFALADSITQWDARNLRRVRSFFEDRNLCVISMSEEEQKMFLLAASSTTIYRWDINRGLEIGPTICTKSANFVRCDDIKESADLDAIVALGHTAVSKSVMMFWSRKTGQLLVTIDPDILLSEFPVWFPSDMKGMRVIVQVLPSCINLRSSHVSAGRGYAALSIPIQRDHSGSIYLMEKGSKINFLEILPRITHDLEKNCIVLVDDDSTEVLLSQRGCPYQAHEKLFLREVNVIIASAPDGTIAFFDLVF